MLLGSKELHIYADHKNLTYEKLTSQWVLHWQLYIEEYNPQFHYIKGSNNALADALSRLPACEGQSMQTTSLTLSLCSPQERMSSIYYDKADLHDHTFIENSYFIVLSLIIGPHFHLA